MADFRIFPVAIMSFALLSCAGIGATSSPSAAPAETSEIALVVPFPELTPNPFEQKQRRKWGHPVIADLDQDGYRDLLLTDHGYAVKLYWNNSGTFSEPYDVLVGDTHGVAVADFDDDGLMELAITRGGGSGTNARNAKLFRVGKDRTITELAEQDPELRQMRGRTSKWVDGDQDGDLDLMLFGFPARPPIEEGENDVYENIGSGQFRMHSRLPRTYNDDELTLTTDFNGDGDLDFIRYGNKSMTFHRGLSGLAYKDVSADVFPSKIGNVTSVAELDYDNDGDMDLYVARGELPGKAETFYDAENKRLAFYFKRGSHKLPDLDLGETLVLRSFQSQYPDHKIWVGESAYEWKRPGEWHSVKNIEIEVSEALGWPDRLEERGLHFGYVGNGKWRLAFDMFPPSSGVIEGVKPFTESEHVEKLPDLLLRNDGGVFTNVAVPAGLQRLEHTTAVAAGDLNNDGLIDLFLVNRGDLVRGVTQTIFMNQGNGTFSALEGHGVVSEELGAFGAGGELFDYDNDGRLDIVYGNERGFWHLHKNKMVGIARNGFVTVNVGRTPSGKAGAMGALATLEGCGVKQMRRIGASGAPYSQTLDNVLHFGVGACRDVQSVQIDWVNGESQMLQAQPNTHISTK